ncbi:MAG TPA: energy transducer TonB [Blastocatellia bacterium]|nr:energy transducer TonB [Blastocatellia bacterium]
MQDKALFADAFLNEPSIIKRLSDELVEASREFRESPKEYIATALKGDGIGGRRRKQLLMVGMATGLLIFSTCFVVMLVAYSLSQTEKAEASVEDQEMVKHWVNPDDFKQQPIEAPKDGKKASGGGGGGRKSVTPPSKGQLPKFSLTPPIIAPRPEPQLKPPLLPVPETVQVDPRLQPKRDDLMPTGLPTGVPGPPSPGPGSGGGMGSGDGGGMGSGDGRGVGPGRGYNMGGGDPGLGTGTDPNRPATDVDTRPMLLNRPRPNYTEEARKNKIQGVVRVRVLIGPDGSVRQVRLVGGGLPDGLNEEAIRAAYQLRFKAAMKGGRPVAFWQAVDIEFNLR